MALPEFTMRQLLEAGSHFGHRTQRWNPKMAPFIYGARSDIHIIDLTQTVPLLHQALVALRDVVADGGRVLAVLPRPAAGLDADQLNLRVVHERVEDPGRVAPAADTRDHHVRQASLRLQ